MKIDDKIVAISFVAKEGKRNVQLLFRNFTTSQLSSACSLEILLGREEFAVSWRTISWTRKKKTKKKKIDVHSQDFIANCDVILLYEFILIPVFFFLRH